MKTHLTTLENVTRVHSNGTSNRKWDWLLWALVAKDFACCLDAQFYFNKRNKGKMTSYNYIHNILPKQEITNNLSNFSSLEEFI